MDGGTALAVPTDLRDSPKTAPGDGYTYEANPTRTRPAIPILTGVWWPDKRPVHRGARWDDITPFGPSSVGEEGLHGEPVTGTPEEEVRDIVAYSREIADEPDEAVHSGPPR